MSRLRRIIAALGLLVLCAELFHPSSNFVRLQTSSPDEIHSTAVQAAVPVQLSQSRHRTIHWLSDAVVSRRMDWTLAVSEPAQRARHASIPPFVKRSFPLPLKISPDGDLA